MHSTQNRNSKWNENENKQNVTPINELIRWQNKMISAANSSFKWQKREDTVQFVRFVVFGMRTRWKDRCAVWQGSMARPKATINLKRKKSWAPKHHLHKTWIIDLVGAAPFLSLSVRVFLLLYCFKHNSKHPKICFIQADNNKSFSSNNRGKIRLILSSIELCVVCLR